MPHSNMTPEDKLFNELSKKAGNVAYEAIVNTKDDRAFGALMLIVLGLLAFAGAEAIKLTFRRKYAISGIGLAKAIISSFAFLIIAYVNYKAMQRGGSISYGSESSLWFTSIFYACLGGLVFFRAIISRNSGQSGTDSQGFSILGFLLGNTDQKSIRGFYEPFLFFSLGMFFLQYSYLLSMPLIFCAISAFINEARAGSSIAGDTEGRSAANYTNNRNRTSAQ